MNAVLFFDFKPKNDITTFSDGCLGSRNDEERSEKRYVMWIAELSESSKFWTHIALLAQLPACLRQCRLPNLTPKGGFECFSLLDRITWSEVAGYCIKQQAQLVC